MLTLPEYLDRLKQLPPSADLLEVIELLENYAKEGAEKSVIAGKLRQKIAYFLVSPALSFDIRKNIFEMSLALTKDAPLNNDDPVSNDIIPEAYVIYLSSGFQLDIYNLVSFHNAREPRAEENENENKKWLRNPYNIELKLNPFDVAHIKKIATDKNLIIENLYIEEIIQLYPNPAPEGYLEGEYPPQRPELLENNYRLPYHLENDRDRIIDPPQNPPQENFPELNIGPNQPPRNPAQPESSFLKQSIITVVAAIASLPLALAAADETLRQTKSKVAAVSVAGITIATSIYTHFKLISAFSDAFAKRGNNRRNNPIRPEAALPNFRPLYRNMMFRLAPENVNELDNANNNPEDFAVNWLQRGI